ncbi:MAG: hypothetical protein OXD30_07320 [Bryobacterales bacterium]|nr:hypothetical protein [Bryobacterales bacterium]
MTEWITAAAVVAILIAVGSALFKFGIWMGSINTQLAGITKTISEFNKKFEDIGRKFEDIGRKFEDIDRKFEGIDRKFEGIDRKFEDVNRRFEGIDRKLDRIFDRLPPTLAEIKSPLALTDHGKSLADKLGAYDFAENLTPAALPKVQGMEEFEVYEFCRRYFQSEMEPELEFDVFRRAYNAGISRDDCRTVMTLVLRDELLKRLGLGGDD